MTKKDLIQTMNQEWQNVRKTFYYPQLPPPELIEDDKIVNGSFEFNDLKTKIWKSYIKSFRGTGLSKEDRESDELILNEGLTHELVHYMKFPGSVLNILRLQKTGQSLVDPENAKRLRTDFIETQTNLEMILNRQHPATVKIMQQLISRKEVPSPSGKIMWGLYQRFTEYNLGVKLSDEEDKLIDKLKGIDYLNKESEQSNFRKFVSILKDYQPLEIQKDKPNNCQSKGRSNGGGLNGFSNNEIRSGLKQFAQKCSTPEEYEELIKQVFSEINEEGKKNKSSYGNRLRAGSGEGIARLASNFYTALAEKYNVPIRKKQMHKSGGLYPHSHTSFTIGDSIDEVDAFSTPSILPGITKKWIKKDGEVNSDNELIPDSFILIDNSGSMPKPKEEISIPVLGGTVISNSYINNGSKVAVYSFGGVDHLLNPSRDIEKVHQQLRIYTGGGTTFNPTSLKKVLRQNKRGYDVTIISDMDIYNIDSFIQSILFIPQIHRVHLLYTDNSAKGLKRKNVLKKKFCMRDNVVFLPLVYESHIEQITMGELTNSVR